MPRTYVRKRKPPSYSLEDVRRAVDDVTDKKKTFRDASEYYGVPTAVIFHRIKGRKVPLDKMGGGVSNALTDRVEHHFVNCLKTRARMGHPCHKEELKLLVGEYVTKLNIKTPFKNNIPGDCWYQNFMKRHPSLSLKKPELLQKARIDARRPNVVYDFYDLLLKEVNENNLADKPRYIFNADESGFHNDPCKLRAIGEKGTPLSRVTGGSGRESTSVLACVSADGTFLPPCIVFKGAAVQARWVSELAYPGTLYGATKNGWMEEPTFHNWLINGFIPFVNNIRQINDEPDHKVILIYDGHSSHISVRIVEDAIKANIILIKFPSHLTDRIQPLDKCVFGPVKTYWNKTLVEHGVKQMGKGSGHLSKEKFTELLGEVWGKAFTRKNIVSGFSTTGVFPVDALKFPKKLFNATELNVYHNLLNAINDTEAIIDARSINNNHTTDEYSRNNYNITEEVQEFIDKPGPENELTLHCSGFKQPIDSDPARTIFDECANYSSSEIPADSSPAMVNVDEWATANRSSYTLPANSPPARVISEECITAICSNIEISANSSPARMNVDDYYTAPPHCSTLQKTANGVPTEKAFDEVYHATSHCDSFENLNDSGSTMSNKATSSQESSSTLLNKILKLITLDKSTNEAVKARILNAISSSNNIEESDDYVMSPNKETLDKLFKIQKNTPEKQKKIVIPRLKVATFGEVLTCDGVKERLKKAEEDKKNKEPKKTIKVEKNKGQGKRTKCMNKKDDVKVNNDPKKPRLAKTDTESKEEVVEKTDKGPKKRTTKKRSVSETSESEEEQTLVSYADSDNSDYNVECETAKDYDFLEAVPTDNLLKGNFVITKFMGGKRLATTFRYLCMVDNIDDEDKSEIVVTSLKSVDSSKQVFALNEKDLCCVSIGDIIGVLPEPVISLKGERIFYKFTKPIDIYEKP